MVVRFERVDWRIERRVAAVAASVLVEGRDVLSDFPEDEDEDVVEITFRDWRTAREERSEAIVEAKAWIES